MTGPMTTGISEEKFKKLLEALFIELEAQHPEIKKIDKKELINQMVKDLLPRLKAPAPANAKAFFHALKMFCLLQIMTQHPQLKQHQMLIDILKNDLKLILAGEKKELSLEAKIALGKLTPILVVLAKTDLLIDELVKAMEANALELKQAVQPHPEMKVEDSGQDPVRLAFIAAFGMTLEGVDLGNLTQNTANLTAQSLAFGGDPDSNSVLQETEEDALGHRKDADDHFAPNPFPTKPTPPWERH